MDLIKYDNFDECLKKQIFLNQTIIYLFTHMMIMILLKNNINTKLIKK